MKVKTTNQGFSQITVFLGGGMVLVKGEFVGPLIFLMEGGGIVVGTAAAERQVPLADWSWRRSCWTSYSSLHPPRLSYGHGPAAPTAAALPFGRDEWEMVLNGSRCKGADGRDNP